MTIRKFLHSCILVEENGKKLLIDPGAFCFIEREITPEDIGPVDVVLITHAHPDHYYPDALKRIFALKPYALLTNQEIGAMLPAEGLVGEVIDAGDIRQIEGFEIKAFVAEHGPIPGKIPQNLAYLVNGKVLHPGDSLAVSENPQYEVLALPITAPWLRLVDALEFARQSFAKQNVGEFARRSGAKKVIPIHDAIMKDFMRERIYEMVSSFLRENGIEFAALSLGQTIEI